MTIINYHANVERLAQEIFCTVLNDHNHYHTVKEMLHDLTIREVADEIVYLYLRGIFTQAEAQWAFQNLITMDTCEHVNALLVAYLGD